MLAVIVVDCAGDKMQKRAMRAQLHGVALRRYSG
jgi:hypothetical protein